MEFSINCMLITSDMEYLNSYLKYSFKVDDYYEDNNNHELEVSKVEEEYQESEEEDKNQRKQSNRERDIPRLGTTIETVESCR